MHDWAGRTVLVRFEGSIYASIVVRDSAARHRDSEAWAAIIVGFGLLAKDTSPLILSWPKVSELILDRESHRVACPH